MLVRESFYKFFVSTFISSFKKDVFKDMVFLTAQIFWSKKKKEIKEVSITSAKLSYQSYKLAWYWLLSSSTP